MRAIRSWAARAAAVGTILFICAGVRASVLVIPFGEQYTNGITPAGAGPWLLASFDDHGGTGSVTLTLTSNLTGTGEFFTDVAFNVDPSLDPSQLVFSAPTKIGTFADPTVETGVDAFHGGGGSLFDVQVSFDNAPPPNRFGGTESVSYTISGIPSLGASSFAFSSTGGSDSLRASAHAQGTGINNANSAWLTVPEPGTAALLCLAAPLLLARRRGRN